MLRRRASTTASAAGLGTLSGVETTVLATGGLPTCGEAPIAGLEVGEAPPEAPGPLEQAKTSDATTASPAGIVRFRRLAAPAPSVDVVRMGFVLPPRGTQSASERFVP